MDAQNLIKNPDAFLKNSLAYGHFRNFETLYDFFINLAVKQYHCEYGGQTQTWNGDCDQIYSRARLKFNDNKNIDLRFVRIPTFTKGYRPVYYVLFFCSLSDFYQKDLKRVHDLCLAFLREKVSAFKNLGINETDRYSIFLNGIQHYFSISKSITNRYNMMVFSSRRIIFDVRMGVLKNVAGFIKSKLNGMGDALKRNGKHIYGMLLKDFKRLGKLMGYLFATLKKTRMGKNAFVEQLKQRYSSISDPNPKSLKYSKTHSNISINNNMNFGTGRKSKVSWRKRGIKIGLLPFFAFS